MLLSRQPGDTGVYATATRTRVAVYDLSRGGVGGLPDTKATAAALMAAAGGAPLPVRPTVNEASPPPLLWPPAGLRESGTRPGGVGGLEGLDVYTTFHPRWGYPVRPTRVFPLSRAPPPPRPPGSVAGPLDESPTASASGAVGFLPTSLSLSCATERPLVFLSGDTPGSGWIGRVEDAGSLAALSIATPLGQATEPRGQRASAGGAAAVVRGSATVAHLPTSLSFPGTSAASTPRPPAVPPLGLTGAARGLRPTPSTQHLGGDDDDGGAPSPDAGLGEEVEVSSSDGPETLRGAGGGAGGGRGLPISGSRHSLVNLYPSTPMTGAGTAMEVPLPRPRARVLGHVTASGWDPCSAATLALARHDGVVQLLDVEYMLGGADEPQGRSGGLHGSSAASTAAAPAAVYAHETEEFLGLSTAASMSTSAAVHPRRSPSARHPVAYPTVHTAHVHGSTVQERQLMGPVTAIDWLPQSHTTVVAARRQDGLGYYAELLDLRSPEGAVRYLGAPPEVIGAPFYLPSGGSGGGRGQASRGYYHGWRGGTGGAGVSPYVLCYGEHVACDPSRRFVATVGAQQNKDILQVWDVRMTAQPFAQKVFAHVGYTSLCWSMAEPLTVVGATRSGELRVHSFAGGRGRSSTVGTRGARRAGSASDEDAAEEVDMAGGGGRARRGGGGGSDNVYDNDDDDGGVDEMEDMSDATPSSSSVEGTATTTASSLAGEAFGPAVSASGGVTLSARMRSRSARASRLPARVPAAAVGWGPRWPLQSDGSTTPTAAAATAAVAARTADGHPDAYLMARGRCHALPRLVLLNAQNGELYYQVYHRSGSTATLRDGVPIAGAGRSVFALEGRHAMLGVGVRARVAFVRAVECALAGLRGGGRSGPGLRGEEPILVRLVRAALRPAVGPGVVGGALGRVGGGAGAGAGAAGAAAAVTVSAAGVVMGNGAGPGAAGVGPQPPHGRPAALDGAAVRDAARDYLRIGLLDTDEEEEDGVSACGSHNTSTRTAAASSAGGVGVGVGPGAVSATAGDSVGPREMSGSGGGGVAWGSPGSRGGMEGGMGSTVPAASAAPAGALSYTAATSTASAASAAAAAAPVVPPSLRAQLMRGVAPADVDAFTYLLDMLPLCAGAASVDRCGAALSRLMDGFSADPHENLRVLLREGCDREAYAAFLYGVTVAAHLYGGERGRHVGQPGGGASAGEDVGGEAGEAGERVVVVPVTQAVPGMLELIVSEQRERKQLGLLQAALPALDVATDTTGTSPAPALVDPLSPRSGHDTSPPPSRPTSAAVPWPGRPTTPTGLPTVLPGPRFRAPFAPPPGVSTVHPGMPTSSASPATAPAPRAALGALRELLLVGMGWCRPRGVVRVGRDGGRGPHQLAAAWTGCEPLASCVDGAGLPTDAVGRRRRPMVVLPAARSRDRDPQSFFLDGDGLAMSSLQEAIERRVCVLTLTGDMAEAAELLSSYGPCHPLYPSTALELAAAAARQRPCGDRVRPAAEGSGGRGERGTPAADPGPVWQRTVGCTFWLALALTYVDSTVAVARPAGGVEPSGPTTPPSPEWGMSHMSLAEQLRFVMSLLRCFPRLPLPDVIGLATALLLPPRYTAAHLDNLATVLKTLVRQQYEYGCAPPHSSAAEEADTVSGGDRRAADPLALSRPPHPSERLRSAPTGSSGGGGLGGLRYAEESAAQLRTVMAQSSRCSLLLTAAVEGVGLETAALQRYIDETADVQTPVCYAVAFGSTQSSTFRAWRGAYQAQLNDGGHFMLRCQDDLRCTKALRARCELAVDPRSGGGGVGPPALLAGAVGGSATSGAGAGGAGGGGAGAGGGPEGVKAVPFPGIGSLTDLTPPPGVGEALGHMMTRTLGVLSGGRPAPVAPKARVGAAGAVSPTGRAAGAAPSPTPLSDPTRPVELRCNCGQAMHATALSKGATSSSAVAVAAAPSSHVRKQLLPCGNPECRQWQTPMCTVCGERMESRAVELPPERSFVWCTVCLHGGHYCHVREWFAKHAKCPVEECPCRCCDGESF